jgi:hypothetical protein
MVAHKEPGRKPQIKLKKSSSS